MMAYTETEENLRREHEELLSLCPKGWAWCVGDCDFGQDCDNCEEPLAPIMQTSSRSPKE